MAFRLEIETGNAAIDVHPEQELASILYRLSVKLRDGGTEVALNDDRGPIMDSNGNRIGSWEYTPEGE